MQRVYEPRQMREIDNCLTEEYGIPGIELMERAAQGVAERVLLRLAALENRKVLIVCGCGNNGGDGLAVLRLLHEDGVDVSAALLAEEETYGGDARINLNRAKTAGCRFTDITTGLSEKPGLVVDALFGTGLSRPLSGDAETSVQAVNACGAYILSVDIPSGVDGATGEVQGAAVRADETVTFQNYKPGLLLFPGREYAGNVCLHPLSEHVPGVETTLYLQEKEDVATLLPPRPLDSHKGRNGRALLLVGSEQYTGAALLASAAALRTGAGLLTAAVPRLVKPAFSCLPEAMCSPVGSTGTWDRENCAAAKLLLKDRQAIGVGSGMGEIEDPSLLAAAMETKTPLVLDADALNALSAHRELFGSLHESVILTPHPGEMARLTGESVRAIQNAPMEYAWNAARRWHCVVLLKGATSCISDGRRIVLNTSGNPGLAKGGSGDTLTGILTALLAQGLPPMDAACAAAYLLGASADTALKLLETRMLLASDVTNAIQETLGQLFRDGKREN